MFVIFSEHQKESQYWYIYIGKTEYIVTHGAMKDFTAWFKIGRGYLSIIVVVI
jgi:hypothetical protein